MLPITLALEQHATQMLWTPAGPLFSPAQAWEPKEDLNTLALTSLLRPRLLLFSAPELLAD